MSKTQDLLKLSVLYFVKNRNRNQYRIDANTDPWPGPKVIRMLWRMKEMHFNGDMHTGPQKIVGYFYVVARHC